MPNTLGYDGALTCAMQVTNLAKSIAWYQEKLGFEMLYKVDEIAWSELSSPVARVNVGLSQVEKAGGKGGATLTFGVSDIDAARKKLESSDVRFDGPTRTVEGMVKLATFFDPDGNALMLYQDLQGK